jgi:cytochrome b
MKERWSWKAWLVAALFLCSILFQMSQIGALAAGARSSLLRLVLLQLVWGALASLAAWFRSPFQPNPLTRRRQAVALVAGCGALLVLLIWSHLLAQVLQGWTM